VSKRTDFRAYFDLTQRHIMKSLCAFLLLCKFHTGRRLEEMGVKIPHVLNPSDGIRTNANLGRRLICSPLKADSHIACRVHAAPMPFPCHAVPLRV